MQTQQSEATTGGYRFESRGGDSVNFTSLPSDEQLSTVINKTFGTF